MIRSNRSIPYRLAVVWLACIVLGSGFAPASCAAQSATPEKERIVRVPGAESIVVVHSKTGNTARMGRAIAEAMKADFVWLTARTKGCSATVEPATIDLSAYRLVFIGSPIWFGQETPYIDAFVDKNDLADKYVVLFNTMGGNLNRGFPESWIGHVTRAGGSVVDHLAVARIGRSAEDVEEEIMRRIAARGEIAGHEIVTRAE